MNKTKKLVRNVDFNKSYCIFCKRNGTKLTSTKQGREKIWNSAKEKKDEVYNLLSDNFKKNEVFFYHMVYACYKKYVVLPKKICEQIKAATQNDSVSVTSKNNDNDAGNTETVGSAVDEGSVSQNSTAGAAVPIYIPAFREIMNVSGISTDQPDNFNLSNMASNEDNKVSTPNSTATEPMRLPIFEDVMDISRNPTDEQDDFGMNNNTDSSLELFSSEIKSFAIFDEIDKIMKDLENGKVFYLSDLRDNINSSNKIDIRNSDIKKFIEKNFSNTIKFAKSPQRNRGIIIYHSKVTMDDVIHLKLPEEVLKKSAQIIRESLFNTNYDLDDRFCDSNDLKNSYENEKIPAHILRFFIKLFDFDDKKYCQSLNDDNVFLDASMNISNKKLLKINSIYQSMFYILHRGKKRTPLQTILSMRIHNLCKSKYLITSLNHMGLGISYAEVERLKNSIALFAAKKYKTATPLPLNLNPSKFTICAFDNFDHLEGTMSGLCSTHDTVTVFFSRKRQQLFTFELKTESFYDRC